MLRNRNADKIREAGYGIPSDSVIRRLGGIDMLEMDGELNLKVRVPSPDDSENTCSFFQRWMMERK